MKKELKLGGGGKPPPNILKKELKSGGGGKPPPNIPSLNSFFRPQRGQNEVAIAVDIGAGPQRGPM